MTPEQEGQLGRLADLLAHAPFNLLSRHDRELVWERHVGETVCVWRQVAPSPDERWLDLGTGGGLPGLVLAVLSPCTHFTLVDARAKKVQAVQGFVQELGLENVEVRAVRGEDLARLPGFRDAFDVVISRALGKLATVIELSRGFVGDGGRIIVVRGGEAGRDLKTLGPAVVEALQVRHLQAVEVQGTARETWLVTMSAAGSPPRAVPRPNGVPAARPLGAEGR